MKWNESKQFFLRDFHQKRQIVEYCQIETVKLNGLDWKSGFKINNYSDFYPLMSKTEKHVQMTKAEQNDNFWTLFHIILLLKRHLFH